MFSPRLEQFSNGAIPDWRFSGIDSNLLPIATHTPLKPFETACRLADSGNNTLGRFSAETAPPEAKLIQLFHEIPDGFPLAEPFGLARILTVGG